MVPVKQVWKLEYFFIDTDNKFSHFSYAQLFSRDNLQISIIRTNTVCFSSLFIVRGKSVKVAKVYNFQL